MPCSAGVARRLRRSAASVPGVDLEQGRVARGDLLESRERALARAVAQRGIERLPGDLDRPDDPREQERAIGTHIEIDAEDVPPRLVVDERERLHAADAGRGLPRLEVREGDDAGLLDRRLQRRRTTGRAG